MKEIKDKEKQDKRDEIRDRFWHTVDVRLKEKGKSKSWLAREIGVPPQTIISAKYLKSHINLFTVIKVSKALDCTAEELLLGSQATNISVKKSTIEKAKEETHTNRFIGLIELFQELSPSAREAVIIHTFSLLGMTPKETFEHLNKVGEKDGRRK